MNKKNLFKLSIEYLLQNNIGKGLDSDIIISTELQKQIALFRFPLRVDAIAFMVCLKGTASISVNMKEHVISKNMYILSLPENMIGLNYISKDFEGYTMLLSMDYLQSISLNLKDVIPYYAYIRIQPCFQVSNSNVNVFIQYFNLLSILLDQENGERKKDIIKGLINSQIHKLAEDLDKHGIRSIFLKTKSKEYYFMNFIELLLRHFKEEHSAGFYAKRLGLTPKYLSSIMKEVSGISASQWINNYIVQEAQSLLHFSDMNIMQIADHLNFANQSFFSKYFKHHTGLTPKQYRYNI